MLEHKTLNIAINEAFREYKNKIAVKFGKTKYKYKEVHEISNRIIHFLEKLGIKYGDKISVLSSNIPELIFLHTAALRMGIIIVPINYLLKGDEIKYILEDSGAKTLFIESRFLNEVEPLLNEKIIDNLIFLEKGEGYPVLMDEIKMCDKDDKNLTFPVKEQDYALIIYTSGTTGRPKGVILSHKNIISNFRDLILFTKISHKEVMYTLLPLFHAYSYTVTFIVPLLWGLKMVVFNNLKNGKLMLKTMIKEKVTFFVALPTIFNALSKANLPKIIKHINSLKFCVSGAAPLPPATVENFKNKFGIYIHEGYGLSETSPVAAIGDLYKKPKIGSVGKPLPSVEAKIVNDNEEELPMGDVGEIILRGPNVMVGYYNNPEETAKAVKNNWFFTGDYGKIDKDGFIYIVDRKKDLIIKHGLNIYPREIEMVLTKEENIKEIAVVGFEFEPGNEVPIAFYESVDSKEIPKNILLNICKKHLASYKIPKKFIFMKEIPKTPTGKPLKRKLKKIKI
ncbi:AMP-binding protein [bacterium]|nr:AMP-binding protein [bacterium]